MKILAIDPGPEESAFVLWDGKRILDKGIFRNDDFLNCDKHIFTHEGRESHLVIEKISSYGMPVGKDIFETVFYTGRICQEWKGFWHRLPRMDVKMHICHSMRAKDSNIRQALIDRFGPPGTKKNQGLTYGLKSHLWSAFALAVTWWDKNRKD